MRASLQSGHETPARIHISHGYSARHTWSNEAPDSHERFRGLAPPPRSPRRARPPAALLALCAMRRGVYGITAGLGTVQF